LFAFLSGSFHLRGRNDEGDASIDFVVGHFSPAAIFAKFPAVITPEDDDGIVTLACVIEGFHEAPNLGVDVADAGVIAVGEMLGFFN